MYCPALCSGLMKIKEAAKWIKPDILQLHGLTLEKLEALSYRSQLGIRLKKNLHYFDKDALFKELSDINMWYDNCSLLRDIAVDSRIKSIHSAILKYYRYYPDHQAAKVFNDMLGFRALCNNYDDVLLLSSYDKLRVADLSNGKANDDGYHGVHVYYQLRSYHYPIEIQYNTYYDRQLNNWLHKYLYKKGYPDIIGTSLRCKYENGKIKNEQEFKEVLEHVLFDCKKI